jgi:translin
VFYTNGGGNLSALKTVLKEVKKELTQKDKVRENAQESMRKATSHSKQAILLIHQKRFEEAKKLIENAKVTISKLQELSKEYPEIIHSGMFSAALQEYSEANIFLKLIEESRFVSPKEINVFAVDYVLGLADVVGEYRRLALDALREGDVKKGEKCLETMDEIYVELMAMDETYMLVPGLRRKCDVARRIIEATRGDITQEVRRKSLEDHLRRFEQAQAKRRQPRKG